MDTETKERFDRVDQELARLTRFAEFSPAAAKLWAESELEISKRFDGIDEQFTRMDERMTRLEVRLELEMRETRREFASGLNLVLERIGAMVGVIDDKYRDVPARLGKVERVMADHEVRLLELETRGTNR